MADAQSKSPDESIIVSRQALEEDLAERVGSASDLVTKIRNAAYEKWDEFYRKYRTWDEVNELLLRRSFQTSAQRDTYAQPLNDGADIVDPRLREDLLVSAIEEKARFLESLKERIRFFSELRKESPPAEQSSVSPAYQTDVSSPEVTPEVAERDIFIVHGHNDAVKERVARYLAKLAGREPIILHEQPNRGRTVIEKFEDYAGSIGFAVVLLTADDTGQAITESEPRPRARQNVILELGFFIGALGRSRVAVLHEEGVELPSDISGLLYTSIDSEWRLDLARELKAAYMRVDTDKLI